MLVYSLTSQKCLNLSCWNQIQDRLILLKEDCQFLFSKKWEMITILNSINYPKKRTILISGIFHNPHQSFHTKNIISKPIMIWKNIFQISERSLFIYLKILIIMWRLFIILINKKIKSKILFCQTRVKNQHVLFCL